MIKDRHVSYCKSQNFLFTNDKSLTQTSLGKKEVVSIGHTVALTKGMAEPSEYTGLGFESSQNFLSLILKSLSGD